MMTRAPRAMAFGIFFTVVGVLLLTASWLSYGRYRQDSALLGALAREIIGSDSLNSAQVLERLNTWVYRNQGFAKNQQYFLFPRLGPTPVQVLESGGDCSDKSRLLSAMLHQSGIPNTLVLLYSADFDRPTHTVVETRLPGMHAAADPVFDIVFPDGQGGMLGVTQLRDDHERFLERIDDLAAQRGPRSKVSYYSTDLESYRWPRTVNWDHSPPTRLVGAALASFVDEPSLVTRPHFLEEPALLIALASLGMGLISLGLGIVLLW